MRWLKENWFKLALLIAIFWFLWLLQNGIEIIRGGTKGSIEINHSGWIENEYNPFPGLPRLGF